MRIEAGDQAALAVDDLVALGLRVDDLEVAGTGPAAVTFHLGGASWPASVVPVDSAGLADARGLTAAVGRGAHVVVGNKLSEEARAHLSDEGWSWFDRRVGAHLVHGTRVLDVRFVPSDAQHDEPTMPIAAPRSDGPIRGRAGISYAAALLLEPEHPPTMRGSRAKSACLPPPSATRRSCSRTRGSSLQMECRRGPTSSGRWARCGAR